MLHPRDNERLIGHQAAESRLMQTLLDGKLAHGYLITGPKGIGKATFSYRFARALLSGEHDFSISSSHPVFRRISANSHADLMVLEPEFDEKKGEYAKIIDVDQARELPHFLSLTPAESKWRVVIIDSVDALNVNASNAILKTLEEPPKQSVLLLISHNPSKLLPTIRSRCQQLKLAAPSSLEYKRIMAQHLPELEAGALEILGKLSDFSPGLAITLYSQGAVDLFLAIEPLFEQIPNINPAAILGICDLVVSEKTHENWQVFSRIILYLLSERAKNNALHHSHKWAEQWQKASEQFNAVEKLHLDYKSSIVGFFHTLQAI